MCMCVYVCVCYGGEHAHGGWRVLGPWSWNYRHLRAAWCGCWQTPFLPRLSFLELLCAQPSQEFTLFSWSGLWAAAATVGSHGFSIACTDTFFTLIVNEIFLVFGNNGILGRILGACSISLCYYGSVRIICSVLTIVCWPVSAGTWLSFFSLRVLAFPLRLQDSSSYASHHGSALGTPWYTPRAGSSGSVSPRTISVPTTDSMFVSSQNTRIC